jgi:hypothetical protein
LDSNEKEKESIPFNINRRQYMKGTLNQAPKVLATYTIPQQQQP